MFADPVHILHMIKGQGRIGPDGVIQIFELFFCLQIGWILNEQALEHVTRLVILANAPILLGEC